MNTKDDKLIKKHEIKKEQLRKQVLECIEKMLQGSHIELTSRCSIKSCECHRGIRRHGVKHYLSVYDNKKTYMNYLPKELIEPEELKPRMEAFDKYWELGKEIARINYGLYRIKGKKEGNKK